MVSTTPSTRAALVEMMAHELEPLVRSPPNTMMHEARRMAALNHAESLLTRLEAAGVVMVPGEAADDLPLPMLIAGKASLYSCSEDPELDDARKCYRAMVAKSPYRG